MKCVLNNQESVTLRYTPSICLDVIISAAKGEQGSKNRVHSKHDVSRKINAQTRHDHEGEESNTTLYVNFKTKRNTMKIKLFMNKL